MSLVILARSLLGKLPRLSRRLLVWGRPKVLPLTFSELNRRRHELYGTERTPCQCPQCRRARR